MTIYIMRMSILLRNHRKKLLLDVAINQANSYYAVTYYFDTWNDVSKMKLLN